MKTHLLSLLAGAALITTVGVAQADEPMVLGESQMDQVTAGVNVVIAGPTISAWTFPSGTTANVEGGDMSIFGL